MDPAVEPTIPERSLAIRRATARLCLQLGWSPVHEMPLLYDGILYFVKTNSGVVSAYDAKTGKASSVGTD